MTPFNCICLLKFNKIYAILTVILFLILTVSQPMSIFPMKAYANGIKNEGFGIGNIGYPEFYVTFEENGLPNATTWYVSLNGTIENLLNQSLGAGSFRMLRSSRSPGSLGFSENLTNITSLTSYFSNLSSTNGSITFEAPEGVYNYSIGPVDGYKPVPSSGSFTLTSNVTVTIKFINLNISELDRFNVTFIETGIPLGTESALNGLPPKVSWSVTLGNLTENSDNSNITFYNVKLGNYTWTAYDLNFTDEHFIPQPDSGKILVPLVPVVTVNYTEYAKVTIEPDNGLFGTVSPQGTHWYKAGTRLNLIAVPGFQSIFFSWFSADTNSSFSSAPNTTYVVTYPDNITAEFATLVIFHESGIPQGGKGTDYYWNFKIIPAAPKSFVYYNTTEDVGLYYNSLVQNASSIGLYLTNGTFYLIAEPGRAINGGSYTYYSPINANRTITINTQMQQYTINYVEGVPVNFTETGLPNGTSWAVEINGTWHNFLAGYKSSPLYLPPGIPLSFSVQPIPGYISPSPGTITFTGPSVYNVNFKSASPTGEIYSLYSGYFYSGIQVPNTFGFNGTWGSATPVYVMSNLGSFSPPNNFERYWTLSDLNMGNFNKSFDLTVQAEYSNGKTLNYTYHVNVIDSPSWLVAFANSPDVTVSVSQPVQGWNNPYVITFKTSLATDTLLTVNANLNIISGDYGFIPSLPLELTLTSSGNMTLSTTINPNSVTIKLDSVSLTMGGTISVSGNFEFSQNELVWKSAYVDLEFKTLVSTNVLITGIEVPGTSYTIGLWLKIGAGPDFAVLVNLQPTTNGNYEITEGLPLMVSGVAGGVGVTISLSVNGGMTNIVSAGGGGALTFMQFIGVPPEPLDMGGNITGTVFISATAFGISWTIWQDSGLLYSWGTSNDPAINDAGNVTYVKAYFNLSGYNSLVWSNGSWNGTLLHDVYPYTTFSTAPGVGGDYFFYTYYNVSNPVHPLSIKGVFVSNGRNASFIQMPNFKGFETTGPQAFALPNGSIGLLYAALPQSQIKNSSSLFSVKTVLLQLSIYNGTSWTKPVNVTESGVANSYIYSNGYALVIETPSLFSTSTTVQEYKVSNGGLVSSTPLANASYFEYFNPKLSTAVVRFSNMSYGILNLNKGIITKINAPSNTTLLQVGSAENSSDLIYYLLSTAGRDIFELYNVSSSRIMYTQNVSQAAYPAYFVYSKQLSALVTGQEPSGISVYAVNLSSGSSELYKSLYYPNVTFYGASEGSGNLYVYSMESYGEAYQPLYNISLSIIPLTAPPSPLISLQFNESGLTVTWSVPNAKHYSANGFYLSVNGTRIASAPGTYFYRIEVPGDYEFIASSENEFGISSSSESIGIYPVTFTVNGLATNSTWRLQVTGTSVLGQKLQFSSTTSSVGSEMLLPDGTYTYILSVSPGYTVSQVNGSFRVIGAPLTIQNSFNKQAVLNTNNSGTNYTYTNSSTINKVLNTSSSGTQITKATNPIIYWEMAAIAVVAVVLIVLLIRKRLSK